MLPFRLFQRRKYSRKNSPSAYSSNQFWIKFNIEGLDAWYHHWREPYHLLLNIPWKYFILLMAVFYIVINGGFALAYFFGIDGIENAIEGSFRDAFFFSVHTFSTIGYGNMYPTSLYTHSLVTLEAFVSLLGIALITGLAFARFSQSNAKILFSNVVVILPYNNVPTLMLRVSNQRKNYILEAKIRLYLMWDEVSKEGNFFRRVHELKLLRDYSPTLAMTWTVMHTIDENSPLFEVNLDTLKRKKALLLTSLSGIDESITQTMYARSSYGFRDILWDHQFEDVIYHTPDGHRYIDLYFFHLTKPVDSELS
ncbi:MAG: ion channel [Crocosphaera sp.]|nr:ion channel [Crocosphaera sp.]